MRPVAPVIPRRAVLASAALLFAWRSLGCRETAARGPEAPRVPPASRADVAAASAGAAPPMPRLQPHGNATQLVVDGRPFLILGGELENSTASSPESLRAVWPGLARMGLTAALVPVTWELIEPEEGRFDFASVTAALEGARAHGLRLVLLWFGSWKNSPVYCDRIKV